MAWLDVMKGLREDAGGEQAHLVFRQFALSKCGHGDRALPRSNAPGYGVDPYVLEVWAVPGEMKRWSSFVEAQNRQP